MWECSGASSQWRCRQVLSAHSDWVCALVIWNDLLVTSSLDGRVRVWNNETRDTSWQCVRVLPAPGSNGPDSFADTLCVVGGALCTSLHGHWHAWHPQTFELIRPDLTQTERTADEEIRLDHADMSAHVENAQSSARPRILGTHASDSAVLRPRVAASSSEEISAAAAAVDFRAASFIGSPPLSTVGAVSSSDRDEIPPAHGGPGGTVLSILPCTDQLGRFNMISTSSDAMLRLWRISIVHDLP